MIDIHSHILYGVDDGSKTIEDSISMIEAAIKSGVTDLFLTPHYSFRRKYTVTYDEVEKRFNSLKELVLEKGLKINLYLGSEIDETRDMCVFTKNKMCHTMNYSKYLLLDFGTRKADVDDICYEMIVGGYKPIIAHPERYVYIEGTNMVKKWKKTGALIQINASSIFSGGNVKKQALRLLKANLVDIVSSDTHRNSKTIDLLDKAYSYISKAFGKDRAESLFVTNPMRIIESK